MSDDAKRELLALLADEDGGAPAVGAPADHPFHASLVRLHARGKKRPFFCVHPGSGAVGCFAEIAPRVDPGRPFMGLQAPGVDGEREPIEDLGVLARGYAAEVRRAQPSGPYLLGGWSLGGAVALEMARELRQQGEEVALLALFDTMRADALHALPSREVATDVSYRHMGLATEHLAHQRGVVLDRELAYERFKQVQPRSSASRLALMLDLLVEHGVFHDASAPMFRVFRANLLALSDFGMPAEPYDGTVTLFRCANDVLGPAFADLDPTYYWSRYTTRPVEVVPMPSHHFALFHGDVLSLTAARLRAVLDRVDPS